MKQNVYLYPDKKLVITEMDGVLEMKIERNEGRDGEERGSDTEGDRGRQFGEETPSQVGASDAGLPRHGEPQIHHRADDG